MSGKDIKAVIAFPEDEKVQDWYFCKRIGMDRRKLSIWGEIAVNEKSYVAFKFMRILSRVSVFYLALAVLTGVIYSCFKTVGVLPFLLCVVAAVLLFVNFGALCYKSGNAFNADSRTAHWYRGLLCFLLFVAMLNLPQSVLYVIDICGGLGDGLVNYMHSTLFGQYVQITGILLAVALLCAAISLFMARRNAVILSYESDDYSFLDFFVIHYKNGEREEINIEKWNVQILDTREENYNDILLIKKKSKHMRCRIIPKDDISYIGNCDRKLILDGGRWKNVKRSLMEYCQDR